MRIRNCPHPAICCPRTLTTAISAGAATRSLWPPPPPASQRARRTRAPLVGIACAGAIPPQQPSYRTISPRSSGGASQRKGGPHNILAPALRKVNRVRPHYPSRWARSPPSNVCPRMRRCQDLVSVRGANAFNSQNHFAVPAALFKLAMKTNVRTTCGPTRIKCAVTPL